MKASMAAVAVVYFLLVLNFYHQSHGFTKFYDSYYPIWKVIPIAFLILFTYLHGAGLNSNDRKVAAIGLVFGGIGDYLIGVSHDGIVTGAIAFGIGHLAYLSLFAHRTSSVHMPVLAGVLLWGAFLGHVCLMPLLAVQPIAVGIMTIYSLVLSSCVILSASQWIYRTAKDCEEALFYRLLGFSLFFVSDSSLILSHTGYSIPFAELLILATYYSAQFFILHSFVSHATSDSLKKRN